MRKILQNVTILLVLVLALLIWKNAPRNIISFTIVIIIASTAAMLLYKAPDTDLLSLLKKRDAKFDHIRDLVKAGASLKKRDKDGRTPLIIAASRTSSIQILSFLIDSGSEIEARDNDGNTPLIAAAMMNPEAPVLNVLIKSGANVNAVNDKGNTPLMMSAMFNNNPEILRMLIDNGADV
ncbi:MAG: ankyrin repeat domain-containing protein, partial [Synergistaceae bacterium]|nr:ankyrin repeat domain-containing protein [Synergistaceae bacterium]